MPAVTLLLPSMLAPIVGGERSLAVSGATLKDALDDALARYPALRVHLFDESQRLRRHVLCFVNDTNTRWLDDMDRELAPGDRITILQAVSGG